MQRNQVVSSDSSDIKLTDNGELVAQVYDENPFIRAFALGKMNRLLKRLSHKDWIVSEHTQRLLKGFYTANKKELEGKEGHDFHIERIDFSKASRIIKLHNVRKVMKRFKF